MVAGQNAEQTTQQTALSARWPDAVLALTAEERARRVRLGHDTVLLDDPADPGARRGFVRAVLRVPLRSERGQVYGVFVEVDQVGYAALKRAYQSKKEARVWGRLATRLPMLDAAFETRVQIAEDGSDRRARVVDAEHALLLDGPEIGPLG